MDIARSNKSISSLVLFIGVGGFLLFHRPEIKAPAVFRAPSHHNLFKGSVVSIKSVLGAQEESVLQAPEFVYAFIDFPGPIFGSHRVEGRWIRPDGQLQEKSYVQLEFPTNGAKRAYLWVRMVRAGFTLHQKENMDSTERGQLNGSWTLETIIDDLPIGKTKFEISGF